MNAAMFCIRIIRFMYAALVSTTMFPNGLGYTINTESLLDSPAYIPTKCRSGSIYDCTLPWPMSICQHKFTLQCALWETGVFRFNSEQLEMHDILPIAPSGSVFLHGQFYQGRWSSPDHAWTIPWFTSARSRGLLHNKRFVFHGVSMIRQIFLRLIWHCRGHETIIEHYFHSDAFYVSNITHDALVIERYKNDQTIVSNASFVAVFYWDHLGELFNIANPGGFLDYDIRVSAMGYLVSHNASYGLPMLQSLYSFPNTIYVALPPVSNFNPALLLSFKEWVISNNKTHIPLDDMHSANVFQRNSEDNLHFQCGFSMSVFDPDINLPLKENKNPIKTPPSGDCRDWMNFNVIMMLFQHVTNIKLNN